MIWLVRTLTVSLCVATAYSQTWNSTAGICTREFDECARMYGNTYKTTNNYAMCLMEPEGCTAQEDAYRRQQLIDIGYKVSSDDGTTLNVTLKETYCYAGVKQCVHQFDLSYPPTCRDKSYYLICLSSYGGCVGWEGKFQREKLSDIITDIIEECSPCDERPMTTQYPYYNTTKESCYNELNNCQREFEDRGIEIWSAQEFYECLLRPRNCNYWEEEERKSKLRLAFMVLYPDGDYPYPAEGTRFNASILLSLLLPLGLWLGR